MTGSRTDVARGRAAYAARRWVDAFEALGRADQARPLGAQDLERLAWSAAMLGQGEVLIATLERQHARCLEEGDEPQAARAAFWIGFRLLSLGEVARASGWFGVAGRLRAPDDHALRGWLLLPEIYRRQRSGELDGAFELAGEAAAAGERAGDDDLLAFARTQQGASRLRQGRAREGLALLDEAMVIVTRADLRPIVTGLVYCTLISGCARVFALDRAREWTGALSRWCETQPQLVAFTGPCLVHRAEILELDGRWHASIEEARRVAPRDAFAAGAAAYQRGQIHRLLGELEGAEAAYEEASRAGRDPQPGLALLRLAQGKVDAAVRSIARAVSATDDPLLRARLLPAQVEILLAAADLAGAEAAADELLATAGSTDSPVLGAVADQACGAVHLARAQAAPALAALRRSLDAWTALEAPYLAARVRELAGLACGALGDADGERLELDAARAVYERLGAAPDLARLARRARPRAGGLTGRELEVLRLVAAGRTNGAIARALGLSEKTVDRHLSNILRKLEVQSRAAAAAHAVRTGLL
ncbi:MAG: LuxR C-terminal-related transcriptional regulator [Anaeromyxobacteraceae bacterium]